MSKPLGAVVAVLGGVVLALQARINGELGSALGDGLIAAAISFAIGLVILASAVAATPATRAAVQRLIDGLRARRLRPWQCLGGTAGAWYVTSQGLTVSALGVAVFTVAVVAGQVVSSLAVDRAGLAPGEPQPITASRAFGAALAVVAVGVAVSDEFGRSGHLWLALVPALAGVGIGWQQAVNGQVRATADSVAVASALNFAVGLVALLLASGVDVALRGLPDALPPQWWLYAGGALGVFALSTAVFAVRLIGVLMVGLCAVAGQLAGALLLDVAAGGLQAATVAGVVITFVAVGVAASPRRE
ncbi:Putative inner membrane protein [Alloactinosynnema sp. L-07]|uniref:DMT family transporter n=1 Tax=Alloactinosynnema sp. L-07 TaxID=1653480 RepID=UPI00065F033E|nr:DMT family transporter [Alloactinosynnema sp. L-07]CRK59895.1 Putative inner membrane protein [Alloactinosynnema sp. L-07]